MDSTERYDERAGCARFTLFLLAAALVVMTPFTLLTFNVGRVIFSPQIVREVTTDAIVDSEIVVYGLEWFSRYRAEQRVVSGLARPDEEEPDILQMLNFMDAEDWQEVKDELMPDNVLVGWVSASIDGVYAWLDSEDRLPTILLDMAEFKERVGSEHGEEALLVNYNALPETCTEAQLNDFLERYRQTAAIDKVLFNLCQFPDPWREEQIDEYRRSLDDVMGNIPDSYPLVQRLKDDGYVMLENTKPETVKTILRVTRVATRWSIIVPALLTLFLFFASSAYREQGRWVGIPLIAGGVFSLFIVFAHRPAMTQYLLTLSSDTVSEILIEETTYFMVNLANRVFSLMTILSIVAVLAGFVALLFIKRGLRDVDEKLEFDDDDIAISTHRPTQQTPAAPAQDADDTAQYDAMHPPPDTEA